MDYIKRSSNQDNKSNDNETMTDRIEHRIDQKMDAVEKRVTDGVQAGAKEIKKETKEVKEMVKDTVRDEVKVMVRFVKKRRNIKDYFTLSKSGVITGSADNDPAGIVTYTQVGALSGMSLLWLPIITYPMLVVTEEISARIGIVTKKGLNKVIAENFGKKSAMLVALILIVANTLTIGADIVGMGQVAGILTNTNWIYWVFPLVGLLTYLLFSKNFRTVSRFLLFITPIFLLYIVTVIIIKPDWSLVLRETFIPHLVIDGRIILVAVAAIGTTISPYLLFWETTEEIENRKTVKDLKKESAGVSIGMAYSQIIFYFIVLAAALAFFGKNQIFDSPEQAALALKPVAGNAAFMMFALGILGAGLVAVPVLAASTAYVVSDTFNWKGSLDQSQRDARGFYLILLASLIVGSLIAIFHANPIQMLLYTQVLNGFLVPVLLIFILLISNNKKIMGQYTNRFWTNFIGWVTVVVIILLDIFLIWKGIDR